VEQAIVCLLLLTCRKSSWRSCSLLLPLLSVWWPLPQLLKQVTVMDVWVFCIDFVYSSYAK